MQPNADFHGKLQEVSFPEVLQIIEGGRKTGLLRINSAGREATFYVREGQILDAELEAYQGARVAYIVVGWLRGEFAFRSTPIDRPAQIPLTTQQLLLEAIRRYDETQSLFETEPDLDRPYVVSETFATLVIPEDFVSEINFLKALCDGRRSFRACLQALEGDLEMMQIVIELRREGLLVPASA